MAVHRSAGIEASVGLSWVLTWFVRCFPDLETVARLFDYIIATDPVYMPIYLAVAVRARRERASARGLRGVGGRRADSCAVSLRAALSALQLISHRRDGLLARNRDLAATYQYLTHVPDSLPLAHLIEASWSMYTRFPLHAVQASLAPPPNVAPLRARIAFDDDDTAAAAAMHVEQ